MKSQTTTKREAKKKRESCHWLIVEDTVGFTVLMQRKIYLCYYSHTAQKWNIQAPEAGVLHVFKFRNINHLNITYFVKPPNFKQVQNLYPVNI